MREFWSRIGEIISSFLHMALEKHPGKSLGSLIGFVIGLMIIILGFWHTLMLAAFVALGFIIGNRWDEDKKLWTWITRLFE